MPHNLPRPLRGAPAAAVATALAAVAAAAPIARAATVDFQDDAQPTPAYNMHAVFVRSDNATLNTDFAYIAGRTVAPATLRGLFAIDVSAIPDGSTINSVSLRIVQNAADSGASTTSAVFNLEQLSGPFDETTTDTYAEQPSPAAGPVVLSSLTVNPEAAGGTAYTFPSSSDFVAAVQAASDANGSVNFALKLADEVTNTRNVLFYRSDEFGTVADRPMLTVDYTPVPEPASTAALGLAALTISPRRRRRPAL